ncbi:MAG: hypothetical protein LLF92_06035 [Planctomycetaceae bacterium]|nr:hypothetical protein [Planctomycetaceae bacterium]
MKKIKTKYILFVLLACVSITQSQTNTNKPEIGYLYPAGGQTGTTVQIIAGGQFLGGASEVYISGGVKASVVRHYRSTININKDEREELGTRLASVWNKRMAELGITNPPPLLGQGNFGRRNAKAADANDPNKKAIRPVDHPLLYDLENKSVRELLNIREMLFFPREMRQQNRQLAESVLIKITIDANATPGNRELRIATKQGTTNPVVFQVGVLPEINGLETGNQKFLLRFPELAQAIKEKPLELPVLINSQIMPGDIDKFRFRAQAGQKLVIETHARSLNPYLADAVPGWFQAVTTLYDANGREIAFDDDYRFNPDPVMFCKIPATGEYELEIHDSLYRGREDFVYRIAIGQTPFVTQIFPLGGSEGVKTIASIDGWNINRGRLMLDTTAGGENIRHTSCPQTKYPSNIITYAVDNLPECNETESNNIIKNAQQIALPVIINGRINKPGDIDTYIFKGTAGQKIVAEVSARRLNSPVDSLLRLTDESGEILKWNDDFSEVGENYLYKDITGLMTHHADSYLTAELPADGNYYIQISDAQNQGGKAYAYRLRISNPQSDFAIRMTPSTLNIRPGASAAFNIYAMRQDGFDGEIKISLKDAPEGFVLSGSTIPSGRDNIQMTIKMPRDIADKPASLQFFASANINGKEISHKVIPCEDMMQAFLYRHLVPSQQLIVAPMNVRWPAPPFEYTGSSSLKITPGKTTQLIYKIANRPVYKQMKLELSRPPEGLTLQDVNVTADNLILTLKAEENIKRPLTDNLVVEISTEVTNKQNKKTQAVSMGVLPAIRFTIE